MGALDHLKNFIAQKAHDTGHKTIEAAFDSQNVKSSERYVRQCAQDRRAENSKVPTIRIVHQKDE